MAGTRDDDVAAVAPWLVPATTTSRWLLHDWDPLGPHRPPFLSFFLFSALRASGEEFGAYRRGRDCRSSALYSLETRAMRVSWALAAALLLLSESVGASDRCPSGWSFSEASGKGETGRAWSYSRDGI